jgi:hypothetical protein
MDAGSYQADGGASAAVGVRLRVHVGARVQQDLRDLDDVLRRLLAEILDAICRDVMQQRRPMLTRRACPREPGVLFQEPLQGRRVAADDGVRRGFESRDG